MKIETKRTKRQAFANRIFTRPVSSGGGIFSPAPENEVSQRCFCFAGLGSSERERDIFSGFGGKGVCNIAVVPLFFSGDGERGERGEEGVQWQDEIYPFL